MNHPRCAACPIAGTCIVETSGHVAYCDWAARGGRWLARVRELSDDTAAPAVTPSYPSIADQVGGALRAGGRVVAALAAGRPVFATTAERARRRAICTACPFWVAADARCEKCGCVGRLKTLLETEAGQCPDLPPRW